MSNGENRRTTAPQASGYSEAGASRTRRSLSGFIPRSGSPLDDIDKNNSTLRQRSRMLYMAAPVATSAINTNRTKVVGTGLTLRCSVNCDVLGISPEEAKDWQRKTEAEFQLWASKPQNCDALCVNDFYGLQQLALKSWLMSGDVFPLIKRYDPTPLNPYSLRIHLIEADRVCTPGAYGGHFPMNSTEGVVPEGKPGAGNAIHDGVEVDSSGRVVAYHICNQYPGQVTNEPRKWTRVEAYGKKTGLPNILHVTDTERPDQYRGTPYLSQVIEPLLQLRRYTESELMAALVQSLFTAWIETKTDTSSIPINEVGAGGDIAGVPGENPSGQVPHGENEYAMGPGTVVHLAPGETVHFGNPNIPTAGFETFMKTNNRIVGAGLEVPYDVLLKEFDSSYSSSRGALLEAWEAIKMRRSWFVTDFCQPLYELWLTEAVARGRIKCPGFFNNPLIREAWCGARWIGPVQGQLDPLTEAKAAILLTEHGIKTHDQITREMGGDDWRTNVEILRQENQLLSEARSAGSSAADVIMNEPDDPEGPDDPSAPEAE